MTYEKNAPLVRIKSKRQKGLRASVWPKPGNGPGHRKVEPTDGYGVTFDIDYYSKVEQKWIAKKSMFYEETLEMARLLIVAVKWICDDAKVAYPTAGDFALDDLDIRDPQVMGGNGLPPPPQREMEFDANGMVPVAYDEDEIV